MPNNKTIFELQTEIENANIKDTMSRFPEKVSSFKKGCNLLWKVSHQINEKLNKTENIEFRDIFIASLCNRIIGTAKVFYDLSIRGYNYDVMILNRSLYETNLVLLYIMESNDNFEKWMLKKIRLGGIRKELRIPPEKDLGATYGIFCDYVHSNSGGIVTLIERAEDKSIISAFEPKLKSVKSEDFLPSHWAFPLGALCYHYKELIDKNTHIRINKAMSDAKKLVEPERKHKN